MACENVEGSYSTLSLFVAKKKAKVSSNRLKRQMDTGTNLKSVLILRIDV